MTHCRPKSFGRGSQDSALQRSVPPAGVFVVDGSNRRLGRIEFINGKSVAFDNAGKCYGSFDDFANASLAVLADMG